MINDETIRLILDLGNSGKSVEEIRQKLSGLGEEAKKVASSYQVLDTVVNRSGGVLGTYAIATDRVNHEMDEMVRKAMEATQAQKAVAVALTDVVGRSGTANRGAGGGGFGLMGASYAAQDFVTVLAGGGGLGRALMSTANNITPMLMGLGVGAGLAGILGTVTTVASAGTMAIEGWWRAADSDKADAAKKKVEEIEDRVRRANDEFKKMAEAPSDYEKLSAEGIRLVLEGRGQAERARHAVSAGLTNAEAAGGMTAEGRKQFAGLEGTATMGEDAILARAQAAIGESINPEDLRLAIEDARRDRDSARRTRARLMQEARDRKAAAIVAGATVAGPAGEADRRRLLQLTPGMGELQGMTPEAIRAAEEAEDAGQEEFEGIAEGGKAAGRAIRRRRQRAAQDHADEVRNLGEQQQKAQKKADDEAKARGEIAAGRSKDAMSRITGTDIDERAAIAAIEMRQAGGFEDRFGRFRKATRAQQERELQRQLMREMGAAFPDIAPMARGTAAAVIAGRAGRNINRGLGQAQAGAEDQARANGMTLEAMEKVTVNQAELQRQMQQAMAILAEQRRIGGRLRRGAENTPLPSGFGR